MDGAESTTFAGWTARDLVLVSVIPLVLIVVATISIVRYHSLGQSSWRGVSYGMFATYEYEYGRHVRVVITDDEGQRQVTVPDDLAELRDRALAVPGGPATEELAERIAERVDGADVMVQILGHDVDLFADVRVAVRVIRTVHAP